MQWYSGYHGRRGALHLGMGTMGALVQWYHGTMPTMGTKGTTGHATVGAMVRLEHSTMGTMGSVACVPWLSRAPWIPCTMGWVPGCLGIMDTTVP